MRTLQAFRSGGNQGHLKWQHAVCCAEISAQADNTENGYVNGQNFSLGHAEIKS